MKEFLMMMKDPAFLKFMLIAGGIVVAFNLIRFLVVACKIKRAESYLYHCADAFDGMAMGCGFIAFSCFMQGMTVVGILAAVFAFVFFCCDRKYTQIRHDSSATQETQSILDSVEG